MVCAFALDNLHVHEQVFVEKGNNSGVHHQKDS